MRRSISWLDVEQQEEVQNCLGKDFRYSSSVYGARLPDPCRDGRKVDAAGAEAGAKDSPFSTPVLGTF